jgi:hypothetical protein
MKRAHTSRLLDLPDDAALDVAMIAACLGFGLVALCYLLAA